MVLMEVLNILSLKFPLGLMNFVRQLWTEWHWIRLQLLVSPPLSLLDHRVGSQGTISGSMTNSFISSLVCHISWRWEFNTLFLFAKLQTGVMYCREHVDIGIPVERWKSERKAASSFSFTGVRFIASFKAFL